MAKESKPDFQAAIDELTKLAKQIEKEYWAHALPKRMSIAGIRMGIKHLKEWHTVEECKHFTCAQHAEHWKETLKARLRDDA